MDVFDIRDQVVSDYQSFTTGFVEPRDPRIADYLQQHDHPFASGSAADRNPQMLSIFKIIGNCNNPAPVSPSGTRISARCPLPKGHADLFSGP